MKREEEENYAQLIDFINQSPIGIIKADAKGEIELLNAVGAQLLIPLSITSKVDLSNIQSLLKFFDANLVNQIQAYSKSFGTICEDYRFQVNVKGATEGQHFNMTVNRISEDVYQYTLKDISAIVAKEIELKQLIEASAMQAGKLEMSTGLLHDVGNAVTAFGTEVAKLKSALEWRELKDLDKVLNLFTKNESGLDQAIGAGKGQALIKFIQAIKNSLSQKNELMQKGSTKLYNSTSHIQDVLNIQRHYVKDKGKSKRELISLQAVIEDSLAIQAGIIAKRDIKLIKDFDSKIPKIEGDHTRLIQVLINCLKNSTEAFDGLAKDEERTITVSLKKLEDEQHILLEIADNAAGFNSEFGAKLFERGQTSKDSGSGFGLYNCKQIVESHHGEIYITSPGLNKGATLSIKLPY